MLDIKLCSTCKQEKLTSEFYKSKKLKCGFASQCKECHKLWAKINKDKVKESRKKSAKNETSKAKKRLWTINNREKLNKRSNELRTQKRWENRERPVKADIKQTRHNYYARNKAKWANYRTELKVCKEQATTKWSNKKSIEAIYAMARFLTAVVGIRYHVDHLVPLRSNLVCGLHTENNLSIIRANENLKKGNRYWKDMPS
jgi:head-tail adaptor